MFIISGIQSAAADHIDIEDNTTNYNTQCCKKVIVPNILNLIMKQISISDKENLSDYKT